MTCRLREASRRRFDPFPKVHYECIGKRRGGHPCSAWCLYLQALVRRCLEEQREEASIVVRTHTLV